MNPAEQYTRHLVDEDDGHLAVVAERDGHLLGVASAEPLPDAAAEVALFVADGSHHTGVGTLLLEHLATAARHAGWERFTALVLAENRAMIDVFPACRLRHPPGRDRGRRGRGPPGSSRHAAVGSGGGRTRAPGGHCFSRSVAGAAVRGGDRDRSRSGRDQPDGDAQPERQGFHRTGRCGAQTSGRSRGDRRTAGPPVGDRDSLGA